MAKNKNRRKRQNRKKTDPKGILTQIEGKLQQVGFNVPCDFCKRIDSFPIRIPKPENWYWTADGQISFDVFYCCSQQTCVESGTNIYREALEEGIVIDGEPPENLFPSQEE